MTVAEGKRFVPIVAPSKTLQWGRNLTVAEGVALWVGSCQSKALQWGRNLTVAEGATLNSVAASEGSCFNGAAT